MDLNPHSFNYVSVQFTPLKVLLFLLGFFPCMTHRPFYYPTSHGGKRVLYIVINCSMINSRHLSREILDKCAGIDQNTHHLEVNKPRLRK